MDEILKEKGDIPLELVTKYFAMMKEMAKQRVSKDSDYKKGDGRFKHLDDL